MTLEDGARRHVAASEFSFTMDADDRERLRWYLEDFLEYPLDPAPDIAADVEERLRQLGTALFEVVFGSRDATNLWARVQEHLPQTRVEIVSEVTDLPWELLRDPLTDDAVALQAAVFVHANQSPARPVQLPTSDVSTLRVLLVICRPRGDVDVPFRSVARQLADIRSEGFQLDVLRPPTFARLSAALDEAAREGQPYHAVHFDGHGTWADLRSGGGAGPRTATRYDRRSGAHGYLVFEDPSTKDNEHFVDGPTLGALLARTGVSVLVLNACRSAYAEAPTEPRAADEAAVADVHARVRAYGSLAQEITDAGVPGVVAMRYSVYVVTAAQFIADLYTALLSGDQLGAAVAAGRRQLHAQPNRTIAFDPLPLQDWSVPVVYEAAPLALFTPANRPALDPNAAPEHADVPRRPDVGFFGRDETLLALDRAFDHHAVVLMHAYAGAGKTATAAEFARWYADTGGTDGVIFTTFERHTPLVRLLDRVGDAFKSTLAANGIEWLTLDDDQRRHVAMQVFQQVPVLWVWDNIEPVTGFPAGAASDWSQKEQDDLAAFLRDLATTRCKVLLTSRRDERAWLADLPARVALPPMPMLERVQLTRAIAARNGHRITEVRDWRPLLRYTAGNPLTITVLVGQALREGLTGREQIEAFVERLRTGETGIDDAAEGRSRSLGSSLGYGFAHAFSDVERTQLAVLYVFQETVDVDAFVGMGESELEEPVPQLAGLTRDNGIRLLDRAAEIGLLSPLGGGYFRIHPALPWYFADTFVQCYGGPNTPAGRRVVQAYTAVMASIGDEYHGSYVSGRHDSVSLVAVEEANLLRALSFAQSEGQ